ncbi:MAG: efflux RND transporter periplasmic adaptor subunit [Desulfuromonadaceae bacterium]|nr:efflux RND transporter periplasmic adaptor subunit [Desulfuromonadaceae bacterium]
MSQGKSSVGNRWHSLILLIMLLWASPGRATSNLQVETAWQPIQLQGYSRCFEEATIAAEVSGRVQRVNYQIGDPITAEPLVVIDSTFADLALQQLDSQLAALDIRLQKAQRRYDWLQREFERRQALQQQGGLATATFDDSAQQRDQARLDIAELKAQHELLRVQQREQQERQQRHQPLGTAHWCVIARHVESGEWVTTGSPLMTIADFRHLLVPLALDAPELAALRRALAAGSLSATLAGQAVHCRLYFVNPAFDEQTRKTRISLEILDPPEPRGGLPFTLSLALPATGFRIPAAALIDRYAQPRVQLAEGEQVTDVQVLEQSGDWVHIAPHPQLKAGTRLMSATSER